jgi:hypothetical protein
METNERKATRLLRMTTSFCSTWSKVNLFDSVVDPYVFGPSGLRSGFFHHQEKKVRKTLISNSCTVWWHFLWLFIFEDCHKCTSDSKKQKNLRDKTPYFLLTSWKPLMNRAGSGSVTQCTDPQIRIRTKMSTLQCLVWKTEVEREAARLLRMTISYCSLCYLFYASVPPPFLNPLFTNHAIQGDEQ